MSFCLEGRHLWRPPIALLSPLASILLLEWLFVAKAMANSGALKASKAHRVSIIERIGVQEVCETLLNRELLPLMAALELIRQIGLFSHSRLLGC